MSFKLLSDTCSITRDASHFVQVKKLKNPHSQDEVWVIFSMEGDHGASGSVFENILNSIEDFYFDSDIGDVYERFENTLREINIIYEALKKKKGASVIKNINALIAVFSGNQLYITQSNEAEAYLIRKERLSLVTEGLSSRAEDLFVNIASGELLPEDKIIFSTSRLLRLVTRAQLADLCKEGVTESTDAIRELVMGEGQFSAGVAFLHLKLSRGADLNLLSGKTNYLNFLRDYWQKITSLFEGKASENKRPVNKGLILVIIFLFIVLFALSVYFIGMQNRDRELRNEYRNDISEINDQISKAEVEGYAGDKEAANAILDRVEEQADVILQSNYFTPEVLDLLQRSQNIRDTINGTLRVKDLQPYVDLTKKNPNVSTVGLVHLNDDLFAYQNDQLYKIVVDQVFDPEMLDENEAVVRAASLESQGLVVFLTESGKVMEYNDGEVSFANTSDENWKSASDIDSYDRNIYLLSPKDQQIYKYTRLRTDYSNGSEYVTDADMEGAIALTIDGSIYVLKEGGEIISLFRGKQEPFAIQNLPIDISTANDIFTDDELDNLYVLDSSNNRVIILEKEEGAGAEYKKEVYFENVSGVKDIYVREGDRELYLITDTAIYLVEI